MAEESLYAMLPPWALLLTNSMKNLEQETFSALWPSMLQEWLLGLLVKAMILLLLNITVEKVKTNTN